LLAGPAHADRLNELLFNYEAGRAFARSMQRSVVPLRAYKKMPAHLDPSTAQPIIGFAVAVAGPKGGRARLLTSGPIAKEAVRIDLRSPSGRWVRVDKAVTLGDGAIGELTCDDFWLRAELVALALNSTIELKRTTPVFAVDGLHAQFPTLRKGLVVNVIDPDKAPVKGVYINDIRFAHGTALLAADGSLLGINYRRAPDSDERSLAIDAETLGAWLSPKSKTADPKPAAP